MMFINRNVEIVAPNKLEDLEDSSKLYTITGKRKPRIFLAGGITNCPDWQSNLCQHLSDVPVVLFNPRCPNMIDKTGINAEEQIIWEYTYIQKADFVAFWFSRGSLNPIVLFEYGKELKKDPNRLIVGVDSEYERKYDVIMQTELEWKQLSIATNIKIFERYIRQTVKKYLKEQK